VVCVVNFIVCDDNKKICDNILKIINGVMMKNTFEYKIHSYYDYDAKFAKVIASKMANKIYILDIETPSGSGIDVVRKIREKDVDSIIIFLTGHDELSYTILKNEFMFLSFICKFDDYTNRLKNSIQKALQVVGKKQVLTIVGHSTIYTIPLQDILYITRDSVDRKIVVVTDYSEFKINKSLNEVKEELSDAFWFSHRSCIVNTDRIRKLDKKKNVITFDNGQEIDMINQEFKKKMGELIECKKW